MPQETKSHASFAQAHTTLHGLAVTREDEAALLKALEQAFDYRGDVTVTLTSGKSVSGYIFDRRTGATLRDSSLRILPEGSNEKVKIGYAEIARLEFTGKDAAHGKTFENWVKRYIEKKLAGEKASIESEAL